MSNSLQKYEWMLRIPLCNMRTSKDLLKRIPDPQPADESSLLDALQAIDSAIYNLQRWADENGVVLRESMHT